MCLFHHQGEVRDDSAPRNVLEMMKSWGPELRREDATEESSSADEASAINGEVCNPVAIICTQPEEDTKVDEVSKAFHHSKV